MSELTQEQKEVFDKSFGLMFDFRAKMLTAVEAVLDMPAPASEPEGPCSTCGDGGQDMCSRHCPAPVEQAAQAGASEEKLELRLHKAVSEVVYDCFHSLSQPSMQDYTWGQRKDYVIDHVRAEIACICRQHPNPQDRPQAPMPTPQPVPLVERMNEAYATVFRSEAEPSGGWAHTAMTAALNVALDAMEKEIQDEGDRISWQGFGAETTFAKAVRARLSAPVRDPAVEAVKALWLQTDGNASGRKAPNDPAGA